MKNTTEYAASFSREARREVFEGEDHYDFWRRKNICGNDAVIGATESVPILPIYAVKSRDDSSETAQVQLPHLANDPLYRSVFVNFGFTPCALCSLTVRSTAITSYPPPSGPQTYPVSTPTTAPGGVSASNEVLPRAVAAGSPVSTCRILWRVHTPRYIVAECGCLYHESCLFAFLTEHNDTVAHQLSIRQGRSTCMSCWRIRTEVASLGVRCELLEKMMARLQIFDCPLTIVPLNSRSDQVLQPQGQHLAENCNDAISHNPILRSPFLSPVRTHKTLTHQYKVAEAVTVRSPKIHVIGPNTHVRAPNRREQCEPGQRLPVGSWNETAGQQWPQEQPNNQLQNWQQNPLRQISLQIPQLLHGQQPSPYEQQPYLAYQQFHQRSQDLHTNFQQPYRADQPQLQCHNSFATQNQPYPQQHNQQSFPFNQQSHQYSYQMYQQNQHNRQAFQTHAQVPYPLQPQQQQYHGYPAQPFVGSHYIGSLIQERGFEANNAPEHDAK